MTSLSRKVNVVKDTVQGALLDGVEDGGGGNGGNGVAPHDKGDKPAIATDAAANQNATADQSATVAACMSLIANHHDGMARLLASSMPMTAGERATNG
mmetsp:Transcript_40584/g.86433  ORF Transcript_40584/g.86433 Transcript_40584/m.86433 type:complete len:98 (+) Transcript_40584:53-346(+)